MSLIAFHAHPDASGVLRGALVLDPACPARDLDDCRFDLDVELRCIAYYDLPRALRPALEGRLPRGLALTLFVDGTCRLHFTPVFHGLGARTRAQILIDWRDSLVRQVAARGSA